MIRGRWVEVRWWTFGLGLILSGLTFPAASQAADFVPGEVIVSYSEDAVRPAAANLPGIASAEPVGAMDGVQLLGLEPGESVSSAVERLGSRPGIRYVQPNWIYRVKALPNDPRFGDLWGLRNAGQNVSPYPELNEFGFKAIDSGAWRAWRTSTGGRGLVGVVDTGISKDHPDLKRNLNMKLSRNFAPLYPGGPVNPKQWDDPHGHGTHVAGTIGAVGNNGLGVVGVNWRTRLVALRVCNAEPDCESAHMAAAIDYAGRKGIPVLNMSLGSDPDDPFSASRVVVEAIKRHPRTLVVNAAGNESNNNDRHREWPCSSSVRNLVCVAAIDQKGKLPDFSNWGRKTVDLAAPGKYILSTWPNKVFPLDELFVRDGIHGWSTDGWQETTVDGMPVLEYTGGGAAAWAGPDRSLDLQRMRVCRVNASLSGSLSGKQTVVVQYRRDSGPWTSSVNVLGSGDLTTADDEHFFFVGGAAGASNVNIRVLYQPGGDNTPAPRLVMSSIELTCIGQMVEGGIYRNLEGTSMSSPHVAGVAALVRSVNPKLRGVRLKRVLMSTAVKMKSLRGRTVTGGRVDAARATRKARKLKIRSRRD